MVAAVPDQRFLVWFALAHSGQGTFVKSAEGIVT